MANLNNRGTLGLSQRTLNQTGQVTSNEKSVTHRTPKSQLLCILNSWPMSRVPDGSKLLQGFHKISFHHTINQAPDVDNWGCRGFVRVIVVLLRKEAKTPLHFLLNKKVVHWPLYWWEPSQIKQLSVTQEGHTGQTRDNSSPSPQKDWGQQSRGPEWATTYLMPLAVASKEGRREDETSPKSYIPPRTSLFLLIKKYE